MNSFWRDFPGMNNALEKVCVAIETAYSSRNAALQEGFSALFNGEGKLLRPGLLIIASEFGKPREARYQLGACLEMLHMATLIHDDVIDDSPQRRGRPAAHTRFGKHDAVLFGDYLLSRCVLLAAEHASAENAAAIARFMSLMCVMEIEQNNDRFRSITSLRRYYRKIMGKSAGLFALACYVGAHEARASKALTERLRRIGYHIGMAFQIIDDILDYSGDPAEVGKPLGKDIQAGLITLPLLYALSLDTEGSLRRIFSRDVFEIDDAPWIIRTTQSLGGVAMAEKRAEDYTKGALREIAALPKGAPRETLEKLAIRLLTRRT